MPDWESMFPAKDRIDYETAVRFSDVPGTQLAHMARSVPIPKGHVAAVTAPELMTVAGYPPYDWQLELLGYGVDKWRLAATSRQSGKSTTQAAGALEKVSQVLGRVGVLLPSLDQAIDVLVEIREFYKKACDAGFANRMPELENMEAKRPPRLFFSNGSMIQAMTSEVGTRATGFGMKNRGGPMSRLIVDEAAFVRWEAVTAVSPALTSTGGDVMVTSTVHVDFGWFWLTLNGFKGGKRELFHVIRKTADDIPHLTPARLAEQYDLFTGGEGEGETAFMREFYLVPPPRRGGLITAKALEALGGVDKDDPLGDWQPSWDKLIPV